MSVDVLREVFRLSQSKGVARNVLTVLADAAHPDGVTWLPIEPSKNGDPKKCLMHRANASRRAVIDAVATLEALGEVEVRQAQRGKSRFNVYRVTLGAVGATAVDYSDLPFRLEHPFSNRVQNLHVVRNEETADTGCRSRRHGVQISSPRGADFVTTEGVKTRPFAGDSSSNGVPEAAVEPSSNPSAADQGLEVPAAEERSSAALAPPPVALGGTEGLSRGVVPAPASAKDSRPGVNRPVGAALDRPPTDREITEAVMSFPDSDTGSPNVVRAKLGNLPRSAFVAAIERTRKRRGGIGLLNTFIGIEHAERTALASAQLAAELGKKARPVHRAITTADALLRDDPTRYVRILAGGHRPMPAELMREVLHGRDDADELLALYDAVVAGIEPADRLGTAAEERRRWVETHADHPDVDVVIDSWADVDDVEREELHELADRLRTDQAERKVA